MLSGDFVVTFVTGNDISRALSVQQTVTIQLNE
jgi:hypothetical protein